MIDAAVPCGCYMLKQHPQGTAGLADRTIGLFYWYVQLNAAAPGCAMATGVQII